MNGPGRARSQRWKVREARRRSGRRAPEATFFILPISGKPPPFPQRLGKPARSPGIARRAGGGGNDIGQHSGAAPAERTGAGIAAPMKIPAMRSTGTLETGHEANPGSDWEQHEAMLDSRGAAGKIRGRRAFCLRDEFENQALSAGILPPYKYLSVRNLVVPECIPASARAFPERAERAFSSARWKVWKRGWPAIPESSE